MFGEQDDLPLRLVLELEAPVCVRGLEPQHAGEADLVHGRDHLIALALDAPDPGAFDRAAEVVPDPALDDHGAIEDDVPEVRGAVSLEDVLDGGVEVPAGVGLDPDREAERFGVLGGEAALVVGDGSLDLQRGRLLVEGRAVEQHDRVELEQHDAPPRACHALAHEFVVHLGLHQRAAPGDAALALVEVEGKMRPRGGGIQVGVGEDHVGALTA